MELHPLDRGASEQFPTLLFNNLRDNLRFSEPMRMHSPNVNFGYIGSTNRDISTRRATRFFTVKILSPSLTVIPSLMIITIDLTNVS